MMEIHLTDEQFLETLKRIRLSIMNDKPLTADNSNETGNKYNDCSWGMCSRESEHWPDKTMMLFPDRDDVCPKYSQRDRHICPMDRRMDTGKVDGNGCFWTCRIFLRKNDKLPTKEEAIALFDQAILLMQKKMEAMRV